MDAFKIGLLSVVAAAMAAIPVFASQYAQQASADVGNAVGVCCAWDARLADGQLTYKISGGDAAAQTAVREAIEEWETATGITLDEVSGKGVKADVNVNFKKGGGMIAGQALRSFDSDGFVKGVKVAVSGSAFGSVNNVDTVKQVVKHEFGHALGLNHANFDGDLMSTTVQTGSGIISGCDIQGVMEANHWKLVDNSTPHAPHVNHVHC